MREKKFLLKFKTSIFLSISIFVLSCGGGGGNNIPSNPLPVPFTWVVDTPESQGLSSAKVQDALDFAMADGRYSQAAMIIKNGKIIGEQYRGMGPNEKTAITNHATSNWTTEALDFYYGSRSASSLATSWSVAKSFTSIIFGIADTYNPNYFPNGLDTPAATFLTEWANDARNTITIKNILDMRSGLEPACYNSETSSWAVCSANNIGSGGGLTSATDQLIGCIDRNLAATGQPHDWYRPGIVPAPNFEAGYFLYSNCDTMILGEIFFRAVGQDIKTFGDTHLFSKLNITADWWRDNSIGGQANGNYLSYCCIDMTTRDFAKVALLLMNDGVWQGEQVIPLSYVQAIKNITTTSVITEIFGGIQSYGLKFWSLYGASNCGGTGVQVGTGNQKCVPDNTIITPIGFDGQYMLMDFTNDLIMIRFSLYLPVEQANLEKKMTVSDPTNLAYIVTAPTVVTSTSDPANVPLTSFFPAAEYWYRLNN